MQRPFKAVLLDMDGLLLDTETTYQQAWQQSAERLGIELSKDLLDTLVGVPANKVEQRMLAQDSNLSLDQFREVSSRRWHTIVESKGISTRPGFLELMQAISNTGIKHCVVTNSLYENAVYCLQKAKVLDSFPILICRDPHERGKPDPALFLRAANKLDTKISDCIIAEDSLVGLQGAHQSGGQTILIPSSSFKLMIASELAGLVLNDLSELARLIIDNYEYLMEINRYKTRLT